jgi:hypothetical protein
MSNRVSESYSQGDITVAPFIVMNGVYIHVKGTFSDLSLATIDNVIDLKECLEMYISDYFGDKVDEV